MWAQSKNEAAEQFLCTKKQEETWYLYQNFFRTSTESSLDLKCLSIATAMCNDGNDSRLKICEWTFKVIDHFDYDRETAVKSMDIFDRFVATYGNRCSQECTLLSAVASVYIAIKVNERGKLHPEALSKLSRGQFTATQIQDMELRIFKHLSWHINPPTVSTYLSSLVTLLPSYIEEHAKREIFENAQYASELAVFDPYFLVHSKSSIAFAVVLVFLEDATKKNIIPYKTKIDFLHTINQYEITAPTEYVQEVYERFLITVKDIISSSGLRSGHNQNANDEKIRNSSTSPTTVIGSQFS